MFQIKNNRYVTKNVDDEVPIETQFFLWSLIDAQVQNGNTLDYFQKFELKATAKGQMILHSQEEPQWSQATVIAIPNECCITKTIWVIDSEDYQTMLFPEEY
ncbi:Hypothetical protein Tpal_1079 [Trichococcus palustris]|uniref:Uncharacterized protein n=1 Tax=Trichococcus palustris TaxID=140314 RepID=A0A143YEY2_9LACT|nr:DUF960 family protein [Trichococcus palustris]CZQ89005.1 Hypothetical protein Tpal_1079 [Trichococcus palustris]SFL00304.1 protein of unknown function [Trichococcus palustris]